MRNSVACRSSSIQQRGHCKSAPSCGLKLNARFAATRIFMYSSRISAFRASIAASSSRSALMRAHALRAISLARRLSSQPMYMRRPADHGHSIYRDCFVVAPKGALEYSLRGCARLTRCSHRPHQLEFTLRCQDLGYKCGACNSITRKGWFL